MPNESLLESPDQVLSTLNKDGSRRWLKPRLSKGRFWWRRRIVAYGLILLFIVLPWIEINGMPAILINLPDREFTIFGTTFLPTDTLLFMLLMASLFVSVFLLTALFGRLWCGWACPQTVYMEFVYRPIERLFEGRKKRRGADSDGVGTTIRTISKYLTYLVISFAIAHVFLSYFVPIEELFQWMRRSPFDHPTGFLIVMFVTAAMMFDFAFFREQTCIVACPYGRMQSVMLDRHSMIVTYDERRGEPRGRKRKAAATGDVELPQIGDCVDCKMCVTTCPTGIDIRRGLQMECIGCAQCIDACDSVMTKVGRATGLIRYASQSSVEGEPQRLFRPRVIIYPLLLTIFVTLFIVTLTGRGAADLTIIRRGDTPYAVVDDVTVTNPVLLKIVNRTREPREYDVRVTDLEDARVTLHQTSLTAAPNETLKIEAELLVPRRAFHFGRAQLTIVVTDDTGRSVERRYRLQGPFGSAATEFPDMHAAQGAMP